MIYASVVVAALLNGPSVSPVDLDVYFQSTSCRAGYEWSSSKKKCVKAERDY